MKIKVLTITFLLTYILLISTPHALNLPGQMGTDFPCTYINNDPDEDIYCHSRDIITEGDTTYFLIDVDQDKTLNISGAIVNAGDQITFKSIYDPLGKAHPEGSCSGVLTNKCSIKNPILGTWLVDINGQRINSKNGEFIVDSNFDIYKPRKYHIKTSILQDNIKFYKTDIKTGTRQEHLIVSSNWTDRYSNMDITIITPDVKTKRDISEGDDKIVQTYYLNPGTIAEGSWITQLRAFDTRTDLDFYSNYKFEFIEEQEIINGILREKEIKEYPIIIKDSTTPLALTAIRLEAGDILKIYSIHDPNGEKLVCKTYTDGCAIKDPKPGIWLVNIQGQTVTGHAPFRLASTHSTYIPEDFDATDKVENRGSIYYYTDIHTENMTHLVAVSNWSEFEANMELTIISTNLKSVYDQSESDEKVTQKAFLTPGKTAEGRWIVQIKSIWKESTATTKSNYNLTHIPTQSQITADLAMKEKSTYNIDVTESKTPLVITLTAFQSGDEFKITKILDPDDKTGACQQIPSGKESYTCAVKDPAIGTWTIEVTGTNIIGEGPFNLASTFTLTSCGNGVCDPDENCGTCKKDCKCEKSICHIDTCMEPPKTVGEKKSWLKDDLENGIMSQESYDARINELSMYDDNQILSEIIKDHEEPTQENNQDISTLEKLKSIIFRPITIIILIAILPIIILIYKTHKKNKRFSDL